MNVPPTYQELQRSNRDLISEIAHYEKRVAALEANLASALHLLGYIKPAHPPTRQELLDQAITLENNLRQIKSYLKEEPQ